MNNPTTPTVEAPASVTTPATPHEVANRVQQIRDLRNSLVSEAKQHFGKLQEALKALAETGGVPDEVNSLLNPAPAKTTKRRKANGVRKSRGDGPSNADRVRQTIREMAKDGKVASGDVVKAVADKYDVKYGHSVLSQLAKRKEIRLGNGVITVLPSFKKETPVESAAN